MAVRLIQNAMCFCASVFVEFEVHHRTSSAFSATVPNVWLLTCCEQQRCAMMAWSSQAPSKRFCIRLPGQSRRQLLKRGWMLRWGPKSHSEACGASSSCHHVSQQHCWLLVQNSLTLLTVSWNVTPFTRMFEAVLDIHLNPICVDSCKHRGSEELVLGRRGIWIRSRVGLRQLLQVDGSAQASPPEEMMELASCRYQRLRSRWLWTRDSFSSSFAPNVVSWFAGFPPPPKQIYIYIYTLSNYNIVSPEAGPRTRYNHTFQ